MTKNFPHPEEQYLNLLREAAMHGTRQEDRGTGVVTHSIFGRQCRYDLAQGFPLLTTKKVYWKGVLHELYWFLSGQNNIRYLVENNVHIWDDYPYRIYREKITQKKVPTLTKEQFIEKILIDKTFARHHGALKHVYGEMWRAWPATDGRMIDQMRWVVDEIKNDPSCHNAIVTTWHPEFLYGMAKKNVALRFPLCHILFQFSVQDGRLSCQLYQRSADLFLGVPFNIASYALLTIIVARATGYKPGEFIHTLGDAHIYDDHRAAVVEQCARTPRNFPRLVLDDVVKDIDDFRTEHVHLDGYDPYPAVKASFSPTGGVVTNDWKKHVRAEKKKLKKKV